MEWNSPTTGLMTAEPAAATQHSSGRASFSGLPRLQERPEPPREETLRLEMAGTSPQAQKLRSDLQNAAATDRPVLIQGEPGSGKTFSARLIHFASRRRLRPFLFLDCSILSADKFTEALYGKRRSQQPESEGRLQQAAGGTLLLKNVDMLALPAQRRLLSLTAPTNGTPPDVRILLTTCADLREQVLAGRFREDLRDRFAESVLSVPPLRERPADAGPLAEHFLQQLAAQLGCPAGILTAEAQRFLETYHWPGNLRELQNVVEQAALVSRETLLTAESLLPWLEQSPEDLPEEGTRFTLREMERRLIEATFARCHGNRERTARLLNIGIRTLSGKLREYGYPPRGGPGSNRPAGFPTA